MYKFEKGHTHWMKANGPDHVYTLEQVRAGITFPCHPKARRIYPVFIKYEKMRNDVYTSRAAMLEMEARMKRISRSKDPVQRALLVPLQKEYVLLKREARLRLRLYLRHYDQMKWAMENMKILSDQSGTAIKRKLEPEIRELEKVVRVALKPHLPFIDRKWKHVEKYFNGGIIPTVEIAIERTPL